MAAPSPDFDPETLDPKVVAGYYRLLGIQPGADLAAVDRAYQHQRQEALAQHDRSRLQALKQAHDTVTAMLQYYGSDPSLANPADPLPMATPLTSHVSQILALKGIQATLKHSDRHLYIHVPAQTYPQPQPLLSRLTSALQALGDVPDLAMIEQIKVYGMQRANHALWTQTLPWPPSPPPHHQAPVPRRSFPKTSHRLGTAALFPSGNSRHDVILFPILCTIALILQKIPLTNALLIGLKIWFHELGHALVAWLGGYRAIPLPFGWTNVDDHKSLWVYLSVLTLIFLFGWASWREQRWWGMGGAMGLALLQLWLTWGISNDTFGMFLAFGGVGGEFYLCATVMMAFFVCLPNYFRWEINRIPLVLATAFTFWDAWFLWQKIDRGQAFIPWGSLLGGQGDAGGDMDILVAYGWSLDRIIDTYHSLGNLCLGAIVALYTYALWVYFQHHIQSMHH